MRDNTIRFELPRKYVELEEGRIYSVREVADMLELSYPTITWRAREIGIEREGSRYEFQAEDVIAILSYQDKRLMINRRDYGCEAD